MKNCIDCNKKLGDFYAKRCRKCSNKTKWVGKTGKNHPLWKGENISYKHIHGWINKKYGKAFMCQLNPKHIGFFEWANISGTYKRDRADWVMSCHSCNQRMDYIRRNGDNCMKGHKYTEENTYWTKKGCRDCRICNKEYQRLWRATH